MELKAIAIVRKVGSKWCVFSETSNRNLGCSPSKNGAINRLRQVEYFKRAKGKLVDEIPIGEDENDGLIYQFEEGSYALIMGDFYKVDEEGLELEILEKADQNFPDMYWVTQNIYTTPPFVDGKPSPTDYHSHIVVVDEDGEGFTTFDIGGYRDADGNYKSDSMAHRHEVEDWEVLDQNGHDHRINGIDVEDTDDTSKANSFEVFSFSEGEKEQEVYAFDNLIAISEEISDKANLICEELIAAKRDKRKKNDKPGMMKTNTNIMNIKMKKRAMMNVY